MGAVNPLLSAIGGSSSRSSRRSHPDLSDEEQHSLSKSRQYADCSDQEPRTQLVSEQKTKDQGSGRQSRIVIERLQQPIVRGFPVQNKTRSDDGRQVSKK